MFTRHLSSQPTKHRSLTFDERDRTTKTRRDRILDSLTTVIIIALGPILVISAISLMILWGGALFYFNP
jgi:hypothetical protein